MKKFAITIVLCVLVICLGTLVVSAARKKMLEREANRSKTNHTEHVPNVKVKVLEPVELADELTLIGTLAAWESITLSAEVSGKVEWKGVEQGELVKKGQELFRIDTEAIQTRYEQAQAEARLAGQEFGRAQKLTERGVSAQRDQDSAVANRDVAESSLKAMEIQLRKSVVKSPLDGTVAQVFAEANEFTDVGKPVVTVVQMDRIKMELGIPERDISRFKTGDSVRVILDALPDREFTGTIHMVAPVADLITHTFDAEIALDNADGCLKPGMIARAYLVRASYPDSIMVPIFSTALIDDKRFAFVEKDGIAELREVEAGVIQGSQVQITRGLSAGDRLIVVGQRDARPGEAVTVTETVQ